MIAAGKGKDLVVMETLAKLERPLTANEEKKKAKAEKGNKERSRKKAVAGDVSCLCLLPAFCQTNLQNLMK